MISGGEYGRELEALASTDQRLVEEGAGEAVADKANSDHRLFISRPRLQSKLDEEANDSAIIKPGE